MARSRGEGGRRGRRDRVLEGRVEGGRKGGEKGKSGKECGVDGGWWRGGYSEGTAI